jgi:predicted dehydrogenase
MIKIAVVGTGGMANAHADAFKKIRGCKIVALCDVNEENIRAFKERQELDVPAFSDLGKLLDEVDCDAITNVTPDGWHAPLSIQAMEAGKHVLCEKPLATCYADAKEMADVARRKRVINMVNLSYRNSSAIHKAHEIVQAGTLGRIMHLEASYLQSWLSSTGWGDWKTSPNWLWRLSTKHGSKGVLGDVGVHILDFASYPAGNIKSVNCKLKTFRKAPRNKIGEYKLDANDSAVITVELAGGAIGTIHTSRFTTGYMNTLELRIFGEEGALRINLDEAYDRLHLCAGEDRHACKWRTVKCGRTPNMYKRFITSIQTGKNDQPDFKRGAAVQKVMDACFESDATDATIKV